MSPNRRPGTSERSPELTEKLKTDADSIPNTIPRTDYAVSKYGIELLKQVGMYDGIAILYQVYLGPT